MLLLYVLVVSRGEGDVGRYQSSEPKAREQVKQFVYKFGGFLELDVVKVSGSRTNQVKAC